MEPFNPLNVSANLKDNETVLRNIFHHCADIVFWPLNLPDRPGILLVYIDEMTDTNKLEQIISTCMMNDDFSRLTQYSSVHSYSEIVAKVLKGSTAIFMNGLPIAYVADFTSFKQRRHQSFS